jgi:hypothetical protein
LLLLVCLDVNVDGRWLLPVGGHLDPCSVAAVAAVSGG